MDVSLIGIQRFVSAAPGMRHSGWRRFFRSIAHWVFLGQLRGRHRLRDSRNPLRLHLGCGQRRLPGFINIDLNYSPATDYVGDISRLPCNAGSVARIESYHVIEHIRPAMVNKLLAEWFRVLMPGGEVIIECPDLDETAKQYLAGNEERLYNIFGRQRFRGDAHCWGYNAERLRAIVESAGFSGATEEEPQDYHKDQEPCLRIKCWKPQA